jgi:phosphoribosylanthranilate isomerase
VVRVKICGIREVEHAIAAANAGADFIGLVFAESQRRVTVEAAKQITAAIKDIDPKPEAVGVFVNEPAENVNRIAQECGLDRVQLCGEETIEYYAQITPPVIKVLHIKPDANSSDILKTIAAWYRAMSQRKFNCLLDTAIAGKHGGTGRAFNWGIAKEVTKHYHVFIAGGLTPENVGKVVRNVRPWAVDVSSGVETNGRKDKTKIESFIRAVWNTER